jgi:arsenate reductase
LLSNRIELFMNLPMTSLDHLALQKRLSEIGQTTGKPAPAE